MAGVTVSVINLLIAITKDPKIYHTTHCSNSSSNKNNSTRTSALSPWPSEWSTKYDSNYSGNNIDSYTVNDHSIIATISSNQPNELLVHPSPTCQRYTTIDYAVFCYFSIGILILFLGLCGSMYIQQNIVLKHQSTSHPQYIQQEYSTDEETVPTEISSYSTTPIPIIDASVDCRYDNQYVLKLNYLVPSTDKDEVTTTHSSSPSSEIRTQTSPQTSSFWNVFRHVYGPTGGIFITFCITLGLFPSWTSGLRSINECHGIDPNSGISQYYSLFTRYSNDLYIPFTFLLFNVGDLLGRIMSTTVWFQMTSTTASGVSQKVLLYACMRLVFFPLLLICPTSMNQIFGLTVHSDVYSFAVQLLFAMSNGYIIATSFTLTPKLLLHVEGHQQQERMSEILSCAVNFGLFAGSLLSLVVPTQH